MIDEAFLLLTAGEYSEFHFRGLVAVPAAEWARSEVLIAEAIAKVPPPPAFGDPDRERVEMLRSAAHLEVRKVYAAERERLLPLSRDVVYHELWRGE